MLKSFSRECLLLLLLGGFAGLAATACSSSSTGNTTTGDAGCVASPVFGGSCSESVPACGGACSSWVCSGGTWAGDSLACEAPHDASSGQADAALGDGGCLVNPRVGGGCSADVPACPNMCGNGWSCTAGVWAGGPLECEREPSDASARDTDAGD